MMLPSIKAGSVPSLDVAQMREVDRLMTADYDITLEQMMENAGSCLARLVRQRFPAAGAAGGPVLVLTGPGGNGGGALAAARRLAGSGVEVRIILAMEPAAMSEVTGHQLRIASSLGLSGSSDAAAEAELPGDVSLVIDGLIGYSLRGPPRGNFATLIDWANRAAAPVLALDVPSGLDATSGAVWEPCIRATATMTLALPKRGLLVPGARSAVGELYLADIGVPPQLYARPPLGLAVASPFGTADVVRIEMAAP
jgi:NAD(P)H-hydrate epimerase